MKRVIIAVAVFAMLGASGCRWFPYHHHRHASGVDAFITAVTMASNVHAALGYANPLQPAFGNERLPDMTGHSGVVNFWGLVFDGDDLVIGPAFRDMSSDGTKLSVFVRIKSTMNATSTIVSRFFGPGFGDRAWSMQTMSGGFQVNVATEADGSPYKLYLSSVNTNDGAFHTIGYTWDNGTLTLYSDGVDVTGTKTVDSKFTTIYDNSATTYLMMGSDRPTGGSYYTGELLQVLTAPIVMTPTQINDFGAGNLPTEISAFYEFTPGTGQVLTDASGNGNDAQLGKTANPDISDPTRKEPPYTEVTETGPK